MVAGKGQTHPACRRAAQEAALTRNAKPKPSVVTEGPFGPDGAASWRRLVRRKSMREALVLEISRQAKEEEDQVMSLMIRVRQRFDQAGVPMQDVQIRFRNLSVVGMAAVKHPTRSAKGLLVEAAQARRRSACSA